VVAIRVLDQRPPTLGPRNRGCAQAGQDLLEGSRRREHQEQRGGGRAGVGGRKSGDQTPTVPSNSSTPPTATTHLPGAPRPPSSTTDEGAVVSTSSTDGGSTRPTAYRRLRARGLLRPQPHGAAQTAAGRQRRPGHTATRRRPRPASPRLPPTRPPTVGSSGPALLVVISVHAASSLLNHRGRTVSSRPVRPPEPVRRGPQCR
jgi:hypothetical protein